ncbi:MAG: S-layer homology domain-containing protein [Thermoleophilia bacterium]
MAALLALVFAGSAAAVMYPDVPSDHTFATPIAELSDRGIIGGFADGTFGPDNQVLRAQFAKILVGAIGAHTASADYPTMPADATFTDVAAAGNTLFDYVEEASWQGLVNGYGDGTFGPANAISRAQLALMVVRAAGGALAPAAAPAPFADLTGLSDEATNAIAVAYANGIISGTSATSFDPGGKATRGQAAKMTWNLMQKLMAEKPTVPADTPKKDHSFLTAYEGPQTCETCHPGTMDEVAMSLHFTLEEEEVPGLQGMSGRY